MSTPNPVQNTHSAPPAAVSRRTVAVAGILTTVYGLEELPATKDVACLWLLHPRLQTQESMAPLACSVLTNWNSRAKQKDGSESLGLIAVSFDQRNHGSRQVDPVANEAWRSGDERHAQNMFSTYHGTALDTFQLMTYISSYIFEDGKHEIVKHLALGVSLGGHCAWHCILHDPRMTTAVVVIGCPDYYSLMSDRARLSRRTSWTETSPPGSQFVGSSDFPPGLVDAIERYDPAGVFLGSIVSRTEDSYTRDPTEEEKKTLVPLMREKLGGKRILNLSGGADKLVPYSRSEPFLGWLKRAMSPKGWFCDGDFVLEDVVYEGIGHEMNQDMVKKATDFISEALEARQSDSADRSSKI